MRSPNTDPRPTQRHARHVLTRLTGAVVLPRRLTPVERWILYRVQNDANCDLIRYLKTVVLEEWAFARSQFHFQPPRRTLRALLKAKRHLIKLGLLVRDQESGYWRVPPLVKVHRA